MSDTSLTFKLFGQDVSAGRELDKVGREAKSAGEKVEGHAHRLGAVGTAVATGLGVAFGGFAVAGVAQLGSSLVQGVKDAQDYQKLAQQTAGVLKDTGNAAGTSVAHVQELAGSLETLSGVDEALIINGENVLATFTGIKNAAGKGNDMFDQATKASLNLSAALGQDMKSSAIQVGKALNDPIKGVGALSRVGVSFTAQQKDQIKALVKSGDTMGAQKVILKELNHEFGSAAKTAGQGFGGAMARLQDIIGDTFRSLGMLLLPLLTKLADWLTGTAVPAVIAFGQQLGPTLMPILVGLGQVLSVVVGWLVTKLFPAVIRAYQEIFPAIRKAVSQVTDELGHHKEGLGQVKDFVVLLGNVIISYLLPGLAKISSFIIGLIGPAFKILIVAIIGAVAIIKVIIAAIMLSVAAYVKLWAILVAGWTIMRNVWSWTFSTWGRIGGFLTRPIDTAVAWIMKKFESLIGFFHGAPGRIASATAGLFHGIWDSFRSFVNMIVSGWNRLHFGLPSIDLGPLGSVGGFDIGVPQIPYLAKGGLVTRPTLAMVGEAGPEAVIPLSKMGALGGGDTYHFHISGSLIGDEQRLARTITDVLTRARGRGTLGGS